MQTEPRNCGSRIAGKDFGERGNRVNRLAQWADLLISNASLDRGPFEEILVTEFPYLTNALSSIYRPWNVSGDSGRPQQQSFVICTGSNNLHLAAHLIRSLRRVHNSQTIIEIAYAGDEDLRPDHRSFLAGLEPDILFIDLLERFPAARDDLVKSGWAMKPFALLASFSSRAILMDADAVFLTSPDFLFDTHPALNKTGTLFYHDRAARAGEDKRKLWVKAQLEAAGRSPSTHLATESLFYQENTWWEQDSGVVAVDRANVRALLGLIFAAWMNTKTVRKQVTYQTFHGDKETYWLAMELSGFEYFFQPWYAGNLGVARNVSSKTPGAEPKAEVCGTHMLHLDQLHKTPFWINGGLYDHKNEPERGFAEMTHYISGHASGRGPQWSFPRDNVACLNGGEVTELSDEIRATWKRTCEEAATVDGMIKDIE
ncbi:mannosyltransferase putative-domain-containing protein [Coniochaeta sp. 2T2.1]|nr:mannosyltransferase putative-domain-containing protein [Coniochaeta sp. 2T2.1]